MRQLFAVILFLLLLGPAAAQGDGDALAAIDPYLIQQAKAGDVGAALSIGDQLAASGQDADLRPALPWLRQAYRDSSHLPPEDMALAGSTALSLSRALAQMSQQRGALDLAAEAERRYRIAVAAAPSNDGWYQVGIAVEDQGILLQALSRYDESIPYLEQARQIYASLDPPNETAMANAWLNQGVGHEGANDLDAALTAYGASLEIFRRVLGDEAREVGYLCNNIGWVLTRQKHYADARDWFNYALQVLTAREGGFSNSVMKIHINLGLVSQGENKPDEAIQWAMQAMPYLVANRTGTLDDQRWNFELLSRAFAAKGLPERAIFFGKMAVNAQQEFRAQNTVSGAGDTAASQEEWGRLYKSLADLLIAQGRISEAQAVLNMAKEEEVFNFLRRDAKADLTETRAVLSDSELAQSDKLARLAALPIAAAQALQDLTLKVESGTATAAEEDQIFLLQDALQTATNSFDAAVSDFLAATPEATRQAQAAQFDAVGSYQAVLADLPRPTAILQIAALDDATHLFLTLPGVTLHEQVAIPRADLARMVFEALESVQNLQPDAPEKLAALEKVLFAPVDHALSDSGIKVVMLNLDGFLRYVPFAALHDGKGYLVERYAFSLYSTAVPTQFERGQRSPEATVGFGVTKEHPGFSALPGVAAELQEVFAPGQGVLAGATELDAAFDERSLKKALLKKPSILHIASHFNLLPGREDDSFLLLGDGAHLPLSKIRSTRALRFQGVDLLTLSACQTARGGDGAEIDGFAATAQLNGAGAVLASLWPVSDAATPHLMRDFYHAMMTDGLDKAEALRQAQLAMLRGQAAPLQTAARSAEPLDGTPDAPKPYGLAHPYYWSAFVLMGNWL